MAMALFQGLRRWRTPTLRLCIPRANVIRRSQWLSTSSPRFANAAEALRESEGGYADIPEQSVVEGASFASLQGRVSSETLKAITVRPMKLTNMTSVQEAVLSLLPEIAEPPKPEGKGDTEMPRAPRDLMVKARTGTGKTLAFLVPAIESRIKAIEEAGKRAVREAGLVSDKALELRARRIFSKTHVGALILSPTRELATQIANEAIRLSSHHDGFEVRLLTGGMSKRIQMRDWVRGRLDIVVSTTGRLRDLLASEPEVVNGLKGTKILILDEADTMLDMGFHEDIDAIVEFLPKAPERQTFVFSATINKSIEQVVRRTLSNNNTYINTVPEDASPVHAHVPQYHTVLPSAADQLPHILHLLAHDQLANPSMSKAIIFLPTTKLTQLYSTFLREISRSVLPAGRGTKVYELHSKRTMEHRSRTSDMFRKDKSGASILVTSDVSARGVDYPGITRVIQVGIPSSADQYIHRVGRTGRVGGMVGRGDLVLLPWEIGFLTWQLNEVPMKPVTINEFKKQLTEIATRFDENPSAFFPEDKRADRYVSFNGPVVPKLESIRDEVKELISTVEEEAVNETFASMLGYYVSKSPELRMQRNVVLEGCRDWTVQACGLVKAPYVSESFLKRIGINDGRTKNFKSFNRPRTMDSRPGQSWEGRGHVRSRGDRDSTSYRSRREEGDERSSFLRDPVDNPEDYRTGRYGQESRKHYDKGYEGRPRRSWGDEGREERSRDTFEGYGRRREREQSGNKFGLRK